MVDVAFQEEEYSEEFMDEILPILKRHSEELAILPDDVLLSPMRGVYKQVHDTGALCIIVARNLGEIVGYVSLFLSPLLHYGDMLIAQQDAVYLLPEYRRGNIGRDLLRYAEMVAKKKGARAMRQSVKPSKRDFGPLLRREKYEVVEHVYEKELI